MYDEKNLPIAYSQDGEDYMEADEETVEETTEKEDSLDESNEVYELPGSYSDRNRIWSLLSILLGGLSIILSPFVFYVSLILSLTGLSFAGLSRQKFGFFTRLTLAGLMISMIGIVCGISFMTAKILGIF